MGSLFVEFHSFLEQCKENIVLGHRSCEHMHSLISSLKGIINAFLNGQLVSQETEFLDFPSRVKGCCPLWGAGVKPRNYQPFYKQAMLAHLYAYGVDTFGIK